MKVATLTIRLDPALERQLEQVARASGRSKSDVVRDALRRQLALARFETLRRRTLPFAEARGYVKSTLQCDDRRDSECRVAGHRA